MYYFSITTLFVIIEWYCHGQIPVAIFSTLYSFSHRFSQQLNPERTVLQKFTI